MKLAFIKNQYVIASILTTRNIQLPKDLNLERARIIADGNANFGRTGNMYIRLFFMLRE